MQPSAIRYDLLARASREGLPGDHHFYVTFKTHAPGVQLSSRMKAQYPDEITIVLQHQFWDLSVNERQFEVGLSFSNIPERLIVPFSALTGFHDPIAPFTLKFEAVEEPAQLDAFAPGPAPASAGRAQPRPAARLAERRSEEQPVESAAASAQAENEAARPAAEAAPAAAATDGEAKVVSIDAFRKKT